MSGSILVAHEPVARLIVEQGAGERALVALQPTARLIAVAEQGPAGPRGRPGGSGLGQVTYTERSVDAADTFMAGVRKQLLFAAEATTEQKFLNAPFSAHSFFRDNRIWARPRGYADFYQIVLNLIVTAQQAPPGGGRVRADLDVGSRLGPIQSSATTLFNDAGTPERISFFFSIQALENFLANGCAIYLTSDVDLVVISEAIIVHPASLFSGPVA